MNRFVPKYPRTVAGRNWRKPLRHPQIEAIGKRADWLYRDCAILEGERSRLLQTYSDLRKADRFLKNALNERPLPDVSTAFRPICFNGWGDENTSEAGHMVEIATGYVLRVSEFIAKLEQRYSSKAAIETDSTQDDPL